MSNHCKSHVKGYCDSMKLLQLIFKCSTYQESKQIHLEKVCEEI